MAWQLDSSGTAGPGARHRGGLGWPCRLQGATGKGPWPQQARTHQAGAPSHNWWWWQRAPGCASRQHHSAVGFYPVLLAQRGRGAPRSIRVLLAVTLSLVPLGLGFTDRRFLCTVVGVSTGCCCSFLSCILSAWSWGPSGHASTGHMDHIHARGAVRDGDSVLLGAVSSQSRRSTELPASPRERKPFAGWSDTKGPKKPPRGPGGEPALPCPSAVSLSQLGAIPPCSRAQLRRSSFPRKRLSASLSSPGWQQIKNSSLQRQRRCKGGEGARGWWG